MLKITPKGTIWGIYAAVLHTQQDTKNQGMTSAPYLIIYNTGKKKGSIIFH